MSDDFLREVDEELRRERMEQFWKKYGGFVIGAAALVVLIVGGQSLMEQQKEKKIAQASEQYLNAMMEYDKGIVKNGTSNDYQVADALLTNLIEKDAAGYSLLSHFLLAQSLGLKDLQKSLNAYKVISDNAKLDPKWRELAQYRAAALLIESDRAQEALEPLNSLAQGSGTWRHFARELLFINDMKNNRFEDAQKWVTLMASDSETPDALRVSLADYMSLASSGSVTVIGENKVEPVGNNQENDVKKYEETQELPSAGISPPTTQLPQTKQ